MSVYTYVSKAELSEFLKHYDVGELSAYEGISAGIENTNYFVDTRMGSRRQRFVLTLFETHCLEEMPYFLGLMKHLAGHGVSTASPIMAREDQLVLPLKNRPAALVERLDGASIEPDKLNSKHIQAIARAMARMHLAGQSYPRQRENGRGLTWCETALDRLRRRLSGEDAQLIGSEIRYQKTIDRRHLPRGVIHADLFHDNALFKDDRLVGIIDFYFACNDVFLYDVAVALNDWCSDADGQLDGEKTSVYLNAYQSIRPLEPAEKNAFVSMLRAGALRFWISRLMGHYFPRAGEMTYTKNPNRFKTILKHRIVSGNTLNQYIV